MSKRIIILFYLIAVVLVVYLLKHAIWHKNNEYKAAVTLSKTDFSLRDQAMIMAIIRYHSNFVNFSKRESRIIFSEKDKMLVLKYLANKRLNLSDPAAILVAFELNREQFQRLAAEGAPRNKPGFIYWLKEYNGDLLSLQEKKQLIKSVSRTFRYYQDYNKLLPFMQLRKKATVPEYLEEVKNQIIEVTGGEKWFLHLTIGACVFLFSFSVLVFWGKKGNNIIVAFWLIFIIEVANECNDVIEALINNKQIASKGILEDIVLTMLFPLAVVAVRKLYLKSQ